MENYLWIFWAILGAILIVAEIFTTGFVLLWFGIGALAAAFAGLVGSQQHYFAVSDLRSSVDRADRCLAHDLRQLLFTREERRRSEIRRRSLAR